MSVDIKPSSDPTRYEEIKSLSDNEDDNDDESKMNNFDSLLSKSQQFDLKTKGYCVMYPVIMNDQITKLCNGYIRINETKNNLITPIPGIILKIIKYCQGRFDPEYFVELESGEKEENQNENENDKESQSESGKIKSNNDIGYYLLPKTSIKLSGLLTNSVDDNARIKVNKVPSDTLHAVCIFLGYHKGVEPDPLPCPVRSIHMDQIVSDKWDAQYIDGYCKKEIFEIILAANYMDIKSLLHLGSAKIATLIKQMDQNEINRVIEEENRYRRQYAGNANNNAINNNTINALAAAAPLVSNNNNNDNNYNVYGNNANVNYWNNNNMQNNNQNSNWNCSACTYGNIGIHVLCEMCFTPKP